MNPCIHCGGRVCIHPLLGPTCIACFRTVEGTKPPPPRAVWNQKLNQEQYAEIRRSRESQRELASKYNVSQSRINAILRNGAKA